MDAVRENLLGRTALYMLMPYLMSIVFLLVGVIFFSILLKFLRNRNHLQVKKVDRQFYYRDIPCLGEIHVAYWLLYHFSDTKKDALHNGLLGAYLLNWYKKGYIDILPGERNNTYNIDMKSGAWHKNYAEGRIYDFLKEVAGNNNLLEKNEIRNYCSVDGNKYKLQFLFEQILKDVQADMERNGYISVIQPKNYIFFKTETKITLSPALKEEFRNLCGLKNFLSDFSNMEEKRHIEVHLWEDYLVFANLLGIADRVKQQFKKLYPNIGMMNHLYDVSFDNTIVGHLDTINKHLKFNLAMKIALVAVVALLFVTRGAFSTMVLKLFPFAIAAGFILMLYWLFRKYNINRKVKEMDAITQATIRDVRVERDREWDSDSNQYITKTTYYFAYDYMVNGMYYSGYGHSSLRKKNGQQIKIYYNAIKPEKSETAASHNQYLYILVFIGIIVGIALLLACFG